MIFMCCNPALPSETRVALTLKAVSGFSVAEIARAFLSEEATIAQRLVRAKHRIREAGIALALPSPGEIPSRLDSVLQVLYLLFNEGYGAHTGANLVREDLCGEAIRLAQLLASRAIPAFPRCRHFSRSSTSRQPAWTLAWTAKAISFSSPSRNAASGTRCYWLAAQSNSNGPLRETN